VVAWSYWPALTRPAALDIVWCHFPLVETPGEPALKPRPALVRRVLEKDGALYVEVAYGTSNLAKYSHRDLYVANAEDMVDAGLPQATLFHLDRVETLPWAKEWFAARDAGGTPVVGHLNARSQSYLKYLLNFRSAVSNSG
jgi:hypothetical protein